MKKSLITVISLGIIHCTFAQTTPVSPVKAPVHLSIDLGQPGKKLSPMLYGLMTEEINHSYDGGLYAELIQNRVFKDKVDTAVHWSLIGDPATANMILVNSEPINRALTTSLKLELQKGSGEAEFANDGYWGIPVKPGTAYRASFYAKSTFKGAELTVKIESKDGKSTFAFGKIQGLTGQWKKYTVTLNTPANIASTLNARFSIMATQPGSYWFNLVSLFPPTYKNRPNGNRVDLMEMQAAMNPRFLRFPGGDYLEGKRLEDRFAFKNTIGDISTRPGKNSRWYYRSSDGMGLLEFLQWCEDLRMQPLLAVYAGYSVGKGYLATGEDMKPFVSEALDEIEYVIGDQSTPFGARRAADGHPQPFNLNCVEIGNEDFFDKSNTYEDRFSQIYDAIRAKYPQLKIIATAKVKSRKADLLDEHFYRSPEVLRSMTKRYDNYNRDSIAIFVGEWAAQDAKPITNMNAALGDAAWLIGLERNADIVKMECYAPLFANINKGAFQWGWNQIGYNGLSSFGSPSYYAQSMFATHYGDQSIAAIAENVPEETWQAPKVGEKPQPAPITIPTFFSGATMDTQKKLVYLKLVNSSGAMQTVKIDLKGAKKLNANAKVLSLSSANIKDLNSISEPRKIVPVASTFKAVSNSFDYQLPPYTIQVLTIKISN